MAQEKDNVVDLRPLAPQSQNENPSSSSSPSKMQWEAEEFAYHEKDLQWHIVAGVLALGIFLSLLILKNIFGAATILLFLIIIYLYSTKKPDMLSVAVDGRGITVNKKYIPYGDINSFWILYESPVKELILIQKARFSTKTVIPLGSTNPVDLRALLIANAITEKEEEETLTEILARRFRF